MIIVSIYSLQHSKYSDTDQEIFNEHGDTSMLEVEIERPNSK